MSTQSTNSVFKPLDQTLQSLVRGATVPQRLLDATYQADLREWEAWAAALDLPRDTPLLQAVAPVRLQFARTRIEVQIALETRRERSFDASARLNGAVVCSFFEARYGSSESRRNRLSLEVVPVPTQRQKDTATSS